MTFGEILQVAKIIAWLVSPLILVALAVAILVRSGRAYSSARRRLSLSIGTLAAANWFVFIVLLFKAQTPYGAVLQTSFLTHGLVFLTILGAVATFLLREGRLPLFFANLFMLTLLVAIAYAPSHFLKEWNYGTVTVDGKPTAASIFIANPWDSEAEAIVLVHIPAASDYFLSFGEEKVRVAGKNEYIRVPGGVWTFASLRNMLFAEPLPPQQINQFRIRSAGGAVVSVQF